MDLSTGGMFSAGTPMILCNLHAGQLLIILVNNNISPYCTATLRDYGWKILLISFGVIGLIYFGSTGKYRLLSFFKIYKIKTSLTSYVKDNNEFQENFCERLFQTSTPNGLTCNNQANLLVPLNRGVGIVA